MPKILIIEPCSFPLHPDQQGTHHERGSLADVPKATAAALVTIGRALYTDKSDDPSKGNVNTAAADMLKAAQDLAKAAKSAEKA